MNKYLLEIESRLPFDFKCTADVYVYYTLCEHELQIHRYEVSVKSLKIFNDNDEVINPTAKFKSMALESIGLKAGEWISKPQNLAKIVKEYRRFNV